MKNQMQGFFYTYILMSLLYFAILMYGQFVATGVAAEKSSRAMELLITSAKPVSLMCGKTVGIGLAGLTQMVASPYIPFASPMAMFTRIVMGRVQWWEIVISVLIFTVSAAAVAVFSAAIYRIGVLLYRKPPKLGEVFQMLKKSRQ